jgi:hypothetical protein
MLRKLLAVSQSIQVLSKLQVSLSMAGLFIFSKQKNRRCFWGTTAIKLIET